jgi:RNA polymerase sigma-70 factor (ECF subfamily)
MDRKLSSRKMELVGILPNLRRFALSLTGTVADADDLLQSTVVRILDRGLPDDAELLPWCLRVCRNLWIDEIRSRSVRRSACKDPVLANEQILEGEDQVIGEISLGEVQKVLLAMPEQQRVVLELVAVEGYSYKEAAAVLEVPIGTVMSRLARARAALVKNACATSADSTATDGETYDRAK